MTFDLTENILSETFRGKTILVTGGTGYIGTGLVRLLSRTECKILRLGRRKTDCLLLPGDAEIYDLTGDVSDPLVWEQNLFGVDFVFHLAAQTSTYEANSNPVVDQTANVMPILYLLEACRRLKCHPTILYAGTVTVVGIPKRLPVDELHPDHPLTIYDLHKQMAEQYLRWYVEQGVVQGGTLRLSNVYGPGPHSGSTDRGIINRMIYRALLGEPLTIYGEGNQVRDYVYVDDVAQAFAAAARHAEELNGRHFVIGSGKGHTIAETMRIIAGCAEENTGRKVSVLHVDPPGGQSPIEGRDFISDTRAFSRMTGWRPEVSLVKGIARTMEENL